MKEMLKLSTKTTNFEPVKIEINGEIYSRNFFPADMTQELMKHEKAATEGDMIAFATQLQIMIGVPIKIGQKLDIRDLQDAVAYVSNQIFNTEKDLPAEEKNVSGSEPKTTPG